MQSILLAWRLFRLVRQLERDSGQMKAATFSIVIEPDGYFSERARVARANGEAEPVREHAYEVMYSPDASKPAMVRRGRSFAEALGRALASPVRTAADGF